MCAMAAYSSWILSACMLAGPSAPIDAAREPAAQTLLEQSINAYEAVPTIMYTGTYRKYVETGDQIREQAAVEGKVVLQRNAADTLLPARVRLVFPGRGSIVLYEDGVETHLLSRQKRAIVSRGGSAGIIGPMWFAGVLDERYPAGAKLPWEKLGQVLVNATVLRKEKPVELDGATCDVIYYEVPDDWWRLGYEHFGWLFLGTDDHLLRKSVSIAAHDGVPEPSRAELVFRDLEADVAVPSGTFAAEVPDDFERREFTSEPMPRAVPPAIGSPAPAWALEDPTGKTHRLADYRGRVAVLFFWGTWCRSCVKTLSTLQGLHHRLRERDVAILAIDCKEAPGADPAGVMSQHGCDDAILLLGGDDVARGYGIPDCPAYIVIGTDGEVVHRHAGAHAGRSLPTDR